MLFEGYKRAFCLQAQLSTLDLGIDTFYRFPILREGRVGPVLFRQSHCRTLNQQNASVLRIETLDNPLKVVNTSLSYHVSISWSKVWLKDIGPQETLLMYICFSPETEIYLEGLNWGHCWLITQLCLIFHLPRFSIFRHHRFDAALRHFQPFHNIFSSFVTFQGRLEPTTECLKSGAFQTIIKRTT